MSDAFFSLDRTDLKILDLLQKDGRISNIKLAEALLPLKNANSGRKDIGFAMMMVINLRKR